MQQDIAKKIDLNSRGVEEHIISTDRVQIVEPSTSSNDAAAGLNAESDSADQDGSCSFSQKDRLNHGSANVQQTLITGRHGEEIAFDFYSQKFGKNMAGLKRVFLISKMENENSTISTKRVF